MTSVLRARIVVAVRFYFNNLRNLSTNDRVGLTRAVLALALRARCARPKSLPAIWSNPRRATNPCWFSRPVHRLGPSWPSPSGRASRVQIRSQRICQPLCHLSGVVTVMRRRILLAASSGFNRTLLKCRIEAIFAMPLV